MNVTVICDVLGLENNGTSIAAMNLIRSLKSKGHNVRVVCPDSFRRGEEGFYVVPTMNFGDFLNAYVEKNGVVIAKADEEIISSAITGADVVHVMLPFFLGYKARVIACDMNIPLTAGFHCQAENITSHLFLMDAKLLNHLVYKAFYSILYKYCDAVHYPTEFIKNVFENEVGCKTNAYVISNGVRDIFKHIPGEKPAEYADKFIILFTGRISKEKNQKILIDAVSMSKYKNKIQLIFAGSGPLEEKLKEYAGQTLPVMPVFKFFSQDELVKVMNYSDLYVHPAKVEIEAISCLEAMACGLTPIIADSPKSATRFFAKDERNLFKYDNPTDLASKIDYWIEHPEERQKCGNDYALSSASFSRDYCMDRMEEMLFDAVKRRKDSENDFIPPCRQEETP